MTAFEHTDKDGDLVQVYEATRKGHVVIAVQKRGGAFADAYVPVDGLVDYLLALRDLDADESEDEEPADKDAVLTAAAQYADQKANAAWLIAYQDHLNSVLTTKENA